MFESKKCKNNQKLKEKNQKCEIFCIYLGTDLDVASLFYLNKKRKLFDQHQKRKVMRTVQAAVL